MWKVACNASECFAVACLILLLGCCPGPHTLLPAADTIAFISACGWTALIPANEGYQHGSIQYDHHAILFTHFTNEHTALAVCSGHCPSSSF